MAVYNEILAGRFNRALQKLTGIKGAPPVPQLSSEIIPVLSMGYGLENRYLESWNRFGATFAIAAAAGFNSVARLRNPAASNVVAVIEKVSFSNTVPIQPRLEVRPLTTDLATSVGMINARFDSRGNTTSSLVASDQNTAVFSLTVVQWFSLIGAATGGQVDVILTDDQEITLLPGDALTLLEVTVNTTMNANVWWRERFLEDSERS